eukprot:5907691-Pleurochrysis_carterae.AAC.1
MEVSSLLNASHITAEDYDFSLPWHNCHCGQDVFASRDEYEAVIAEHAELRAGSHGDVDDAEAAAAALDKIMSQHARSQLDQHFLVSSERAEGRFRPLRCRSAALRAIECCKQGLEV